MVLDIIQLNIERFRRLLSETIDTKKRQTIKKLLAEEETKQVNRAAESQGDRSAFKRQA